MTIYSIQFLRFFAAMLVMLFHLEIIQSGYKGVDIFFVISGYIMYTTMFSGKRPDAYRFFVNRFSKIYFSYWAVLILLYFVKPFTFDLSAIGTVLLIPNHNSLLGVTWSLSFELYFYFLLGLAVYLLPSAYHKIAFILTLIISTGVVILNFTPLTLKGSIWNFLLGANLWEFLLGILSAVIANLFLKSPNKYILAALSLLCLAILSLTDIPYQTSTISSAIYGFLAFCLVLFLPLLEKDIVLNTKLALSIKTLGDASYAIYLLAPVVTIMINPNNTALKLTVIFATIFTAIIFNKSIETKGLSYFRKELYKVNPKGN